MKKWLISTSLVVLSACSTPTLYPPSNEQVSTQWQELAPLAKAGNCETLWQLISGAPNFPAREALLLKVLEGCKLGDSELLSIWEQELPSLPSYIKKSLYERSYKLASKRDDFKLWAATFAKELSSLADRQDERMAWAQKSLSLIKKEEQPELYLEVDNRLKEIAPHLIENPKDEELLKVARDLERQRQFDRARAYYQKIMKAKSWKYEEQLMAFDRYAMSFKLERDKERYTVETGNTVAWLSTMKKRTPSQNQDLEERWIEWARAEWTQDRLEKGHLELTKLTRTDFISANAKAKSFWLLGMMERERKNFDLAFAFFELGARENFTDQETREKIEWAIAWNRFQSGEYEAAIHSFRRYLDQTEDEKSDVTLRFVYWLAVSLNKTNQKAEAESLWREITEKNPHSYYSLLALTKLGGVQEPLAYDYPSSEENLDLRASWLSYFELWDALKDYLGTIRAPKSILTVTPFYQRAQAYKEGIRGGYKLLDEYDFNDVSALLYPKAYEELFLSSGRFFNVSPFLLMAISRQESSFDTNARSYADAFGLLQVIPEKASNYHQAAGVNYEKLEDLYTPEVNIPIGAYMIKKLLLKSEGHLIQTIASYNAGDAPVAKWISTRYFGSWEQFVENIPYEETRKYVKLVLRNAFIYRGLSLKEGAPIPKELMVENN